MTHTVALLFKAGDSYAHVNQAKVLNLFKNRDEPLFSFSIIVELCTDINHGGGAEVRIEQHIVNT